MPLGLGLGFQLGLGLEIFLNNFCSEGGRDLRVGSTPTNAGTPVRLVPSTSLYDLPKCRLGLGLSIRVRVRVIRVRVRVSTRVRVRDILE